MNQGFDSSVLSSFFLYLDWSILYKGRAFQNSSSLFYPTTEQRLPSLYSYSSPYKSFVYDSSILNCNLISGVSGSAGFLPRSSGLFIDYNNGRVLSNSQLSSISGSYAVRDFNIYVSNDDIEDIILENRYFFNPKSSLVYSGIKPYDYRFPAIIINMDNAKNKPFSFGGEDNTEYIMRLAIFSDEYGKTRDLISLLKDECQNCFRIIGNENMPLNIYGDLKTGYYNYNQLRTDAENNNNQLVRIDYASAYSLKDKTITKRNILINFVDFKLSCLRYPRQYYT